MFKGKRKKERKEKKEENPKKILEFAAGHDGETTLRIPVEDFKRIAHIFFNYYKEKPANGDVLNYYRQEQRRLFMKKIKM